MRAVNTVQPAILEHELAHIRYRHTYDIILLRLLGCFFWPNMLLYAILREIRTVHEYQADACAVKDSDGYAQLLLNHAFNTSRFTLSHTFFHHSLKRRIAMLQTKQPARRYAGSITAVFTFILLSGIVTLQSCAQTQSAKPGSSYDVSDAVMQKKVEAFTKTLSNQRITPTMDQDSVYNTAEKYPEPGYDLMQYLKANLKYPQDAKARKIEGRVIARFVVDKDGNVRSPSILRSLTPSMSLEVLEVINKMPKWNPGEVGGKKVSVYFTLPVVFSLQK